MELTNEIKILLITAGVMLAVNLLAMLLFVLYARLGEGKTKDSVRSIIFELDRFADSMDNSDKRRAAIQQINDILGWRKFIIPSALIGWVIDIEVTAIRKMQSVTNTPNLHEEE